MGMRSIEARFRDARIRWMKALMNSTRGRKLLLDALPPEILTMTVDCGDHVLTVSPHELIGRHVVTRGEYTRDEVEDAIAALDARGRLPDQDGCVLELGANVGTHTVYLALSGRFNRVLAVEPDPRNLGLLCRNVANNNLESLVDVIACAAGAREEVLPLRQVDGNFGRSSLLQRTASGDRDLPVPVRTVTRILADTDITPDDISLVWMDIEGFEPEACRGMPDLLSLGTPIFMEFSPEFQNRAEQREFAALLDGHYAECILFDRAGHRPVPFAYLGDLERQCDILVL